MLGGFMWTSTDLTIFYRKRKKIWKRLCVFLELWRHHSANLTRVMMSSDSPSSYLASVYVTSRYASFWLKAAV